MQFVEIVLAEDVDDLDLGAVDHPEVLEVGQDVRQLQLGLLPPAQCASHWQAQAAASRSPPHQIVPPRDHRGQSI